MFLNLFLNARDAMESRRHAGGHAPADERRACARGQWRIAGAGIAPEHLERIYDPFFTTKGREERHWPGALGDLRHRAGARRRQIEAVEMRVPEAGQHRFHRASFLSAHPAKRPVHVADDQTPLADDFASETPRHRPHSGDRRRSGDSRKPGSAAVELEGYRVELAANATEGLSKAGSRRPTILFCWI